MTDQASNRPQSSDDDVRRMYRSEKNRQLAGVCGGIAEYFHIDPMLVRLGWVVISLLTGVVPGLIAYVVAAVVIPVAPVTAPTKARPAPPPADKSDPPANIS